MVFFTCNACGSSLKKNQVEKHWRSECRNCEVLSCIDCGKDFYGDDYATHTKCVSEAEKYQGALYKEGGAKGEKKQQEWLEKVRQSVSSASVSPKIAGLLERVAEYPNIPRKRAKFENFVRNSCNVRDSRTLEELWTAFSAANDKKPQPGSDPVAKQQPDGLSSSQECQDSTEEETEKIEEIERREKRKKSKKKRKHLEESADEPSGKGEDAKKTPVEYCRDQSSDVTEPPRKKKKKRHSDPEPVSDGAHELPSLGVSGGETSKCASPEKKNKRKHKLRAEDGINGEPVPPSGSQSDLVPESEPSLGTDSPKKRRKKKHKNLEERDSLDVAETKDCLPVGPRVDGILKAGRKLKKLKH